MSYEQLIPGFFESDDERNVKKTPKETIMGDRKHNSLDALLEDEAALATAVAEVSMKYAAPGYMHMDEVQRYMTRIKSLFPGCSGAEVELALFVWGMLNGTGGTDDYAGKPDIEVGQISVPATAVCGGIIPVGVDGKVRQFFAAAFERQAPALLKKMPHLHTLMAPRVAKAGLVTGQTLMAIDFVKGATPETVGSGTLRASVKKAFIQQRQVRTGETVQQHQGAAFRERIGEQANSSQDPGYHLF